MKIGVLIDSFKLPLKEAIKKAKALGIDGIQIYAVSGILSPDQMSEKNARELLQFIDSNGLVISALCGDLGGHGFQIAEENKVKIEKSKRIIDLALNLNTRIVTTHIGVIPQDEKSERYLIMQEACFQLGTYAETQGARFAIETGPEKTTTLSHFLNSIQTKGIGVNFDPANLVMVTDDDPVEGVWNVKDYVVHTHAKDGIMLKKTNPEVIYNYFAEGGIDDFHLEEYFLETPLGAGGVDFKRYIEMLRKINYNGFLTIEREVGQTPEEDIKEAVAFLKNLL